jgi:hypothetical protein
MNNLLIEGSGCDDMVRDGASYWDKLPDDLRVMILAQAMGQGERITRDKAAGHVKDALLPYSWTCKSMDNLAREN